MQMNNQQNEHVYFVNQLYRDFLLPQILGDDNEAILYWVGKRIARKYDLTSYDDVNDFFAVTEFGTLTKLKEKRATILFELTGQNVVDRLNSGSHEFSLEAGIIAEAIQKETGRTTECELTIDDKKKKVTLTACLD
ncbi:YslB family protein [Lactobacillus sp. ESL0701]|uniref:YslB family protein n=1 Tax=Lactobacillus sp. ESL0701 TaxID=2983217 RepID=UPI0023F9CEC2|nr:YslB family protein [Lactobacillus sp. ESL0701]MDF7672972.1 YslB family protein [Lactobacillus sp. ESL0701]